MPPLEGTGVDGCHPLFVRHFGEVAAVLSMVDLDEFCGPGAESRLNDLSWVGPRACRHEWTVRQVMRASPVLPSRFGTLFYSLESLEQLMQKNQETILQFLKVVSDKEEWSVKVLLDREKAREKQLSRALSGMQVSSLSPGARYFQEQRIRADVEKGLSGWIRETCGRIAGELNSCASDFRPRKVLPQAENGGDGEVILNWAFLVPHEIMDRFGDQVQRANAEFAPQALVFELTGPWPPYSFSPVVE